MRKDQSASGTSEVKPVTDGQSDSLVILTKNYPGGKDKLQLALSNPDCRKVLWGGLDALAATQALSLPLLERPPLMTINRSCNSAAEYREKLHAAGCKTSHSGLDILMKSDFMKGFEIESVDLMLGTTKELTGKGQSPRSKIYTGADNVGWDTVPPWVGPELCLQYPAQLNNKWQMIGMEPIKDSVGGLELSPVVHHDGEPRLVDRYVRPGHVWFGGVVWVFARRKKICP